jgi:hypothetical protein
MRSVSAAIRSVSAPPVLRVDVVGPDPRPVLLLRSSAGQLLLDPRDVREAAPSSRCVSHSESPGLACARFAADRPRRAALRVRTAWLVCCVAGWSPLGGRARSESVLTPCSMLAWPVSIELIDLPFSIYRMPRLNTPVMDHVPWTSPPTSESDTTYREIPPPQGSAPGPRAPDRLPSPARPASLTSVPAGPRPDSDSQPGPD